MRVGFTGTRHSMTHAQRVKLVAVLNELGVEWLHHGDCVGADAEAHGYAMAVKAKVTIHPPLDEALRARCEGATVLLAPKTHFARNRDIVNDTQVLVAAPATMCAMTQGGTWYTINYARKQKRPIYIVWPDGHVTKENA